MRLWVPHSWIVEEELLEQGYVAYFNILSHIIEPHVIHHTISLQNSSWCLQRMAQSRNGEEAVVVLNILMDSRSPSFAFQGTTKKICV